MILTPRLKSRIGAGAAALACLALLGGLGGLLVWGVVSSVFFGLRAQGWVEVPARIESVDVGRATFSFDWNGRRMFSDRVGTFVLGGSSEVDDWDDRMDARITAAVEGRTTTPAWVNPANPSEATLDREIRWKLFLVLFGVGAVFSALGIGLAFVIGRKAFGFPKGSGAHAGVPLLKPRAREALVQWGVAFAWNALSIPLAAVALPDLFEKKEWFPVFMLALFPAIGLAILWSAISSTVQVLRDGSPFNARTAR